LLLPAVNSQTLATLVKTLLISHFQPNVPYFGYGCAFMQSDRFQRQGWKPERDNGGLANVLPKNIWLYVSQIPNLAKLGENFVLRAAHSIILLR
jgi:hypothetical protein